MNPQFKSMLDALTDRARENLEDYGRLVPVAFIFSKGSFDIVACPWSGNEEKEAAIALLRRMARSKNADAIAILAEAWYAELENCKSLDDWDGTPASKMKNREEVVHVYVEALDGCWMGVADITRDGGRPTFGKIEYLALGERDRRERFQGILA